jgi:hypothetical protein
MALTDVQAAEKLNEARAAPFKRVPARTLSGHRFTERPYSAQYLHAKSANSHNRPT